MKDACFQAEDSRKTLTNIDASGENLKPVIDSFLKVSEPLQYLLKRSQNLPEKVLDEDLSRLIQSPTSCSLSSVYSLYFDHPSGFFVFQQRYFFPGTVLEVFIGILLSVNNNA